MALPSQEIHVIEKLASRKFHGIFTAPDTDKHGPLKVSYAIAGVDVEEGENIPTILFCGGMFGTRYIAPLFDWIAETEEVRMVLIDRFVGSLPYWIAFICPFNLYSKFLPKLIRWGRMRRKYWYRQVFSDT